MSTQIPANSFDILVIDEATGRVLDTDVLSAGSGRHAAQIAVRRIDDADLEGVVAPKLIVTDPDGEQTTYTLDEAR